MTLEQLLSEGSSALDRLDSTRSDFERAGATSEPSTAEVTEGVPTEAETAAEAEEALAEEPTITRPVAPEPEEEELYLGPELTGEEAALPEVEEPEAGFPAPIEEPPAETEAMPEGREELEAELQEVLALREQELRNQYDNVLKALLLELGITLEEEITPDNFVALAREGIRQQIEMETQGLRDELNAIRLRLEELERGERAPRAPRAARRFRLGRRVLPWAIGGIVAAGAILGGIFAGKGVREKAAQMFAGRARQVQREKMPEKTPIPKAGVTKPEAGKSTKPVAAKATKPKAKAPKMGISEPEALKSEVPEWEVSTTVGADGKAQTKVTTPEKAPEAEAPKYETLRSEKITLSRGSSVWQEIAKMAARYGIEPRWTNPEKGVTSRDVWIDYIKDQVVAANPSVDFRKLPVGASFEIGTLLSDQDLAELARIAKTSDVGEYLSGRPKHEVKVTKKSTAHRRTKSSSHARAKSTTMQAGTTYYIPETAPWMKDNGSVGFATTTQKDYNETAPAPASTPAYTESQAIPAYDQTPQPDQEIQEISLPEQNQVEDISQPEQTYQIPSQNDTQGEGISKPEQSKNWQPEQHLAPVSTGGYDYTIPDPKKKKPWEM